MEENQLKPGALVELHSLQSAKQHNGKTGALLNYNKESERWEVKLASGDVVKVKNANLSPVNNYGGGEGIEERDDTPPLWYDENLDEEFLDSCVFDPIFSEFLQAVDEGDADIDSVIVLGPMLASGMHIAATMGDIPLMRALLRRGAQIDMFGTVESSRCGESRYGGTPVMILIQCMAKNGDIYLGPRNPCLPHAKPQPRSYFKALRFLLDVGANPNATESPSNVAATGGVVEAEMSLEAKCSRVPALHQALTISDEALAKKTAMLLLLHKADPTATYAPPSSRNGSRASSCLLYEDQRTQGMSVQAQLARAGCPLSPTLKRAVSALITQHASATSAARPPKRCPCGSEKLYAACHGFKFGAALHPRAVCPCKAEARARVEEKGDVPAAVLEREREERMRNRNARIDAKMEALEAGAGGGARAAGGGQSASEGRGQSASLPKEASAKCIKFKSYGKCCRKINANFWRETLGAYRRLVLFKQTAELKAAKASLAGLKMLKEGAECFREAAHEVRDAKNDKDKIAGAAPKKSMAKEMEEMIYKMILPLVLQGELDPAFAFACMQCDFQYARPWRDNNVLMIDKAEMLVRQQEWNGYVDKYVECLGSPLPLCKACKRTEGKVIKAGVYKGQVCRKKQGECQFGDDARGAEEIARAAKVSWTGGPLYAPCGNPLCAKVEDEPHTFQLCSKCKQTRFCSPECLKEAWKPFHKKVCGSNAAEPELRSQVAFGRAIEVMTKHLLVGLPWDPMEDVKKQTAGYFVTGENRNKM